MRIVAKIFLIVFPLAIPDYAVFAQRLLRDSLSRTHFRRANQVIQVKKQLEQTIQGSTIYSIDSLLQKSRQLPYLSGQVVALCQLASTRLLQQPPQLADPLLDEAQRIASQLQSFSDAGWAMHLLSVIMRRNPGESSRFMPVLTALGTAMSRSSPLDDERNSRFSQRHSWDSTENTSRGPRAAPGGSEFPGLFSKSFSGNPRKPFIPTITDRWLDSLLRIHTHGSPVGRQLTAQRKLRDTTQQLSRTYARKGDYAKAYTYFLQYSAYKDSLAAEVTARQVALLQFKQATQKKEAQINLLTREHQLQEQQTQQQRLALLGLAGVVALLLAFSVTLIRLNRQRQQANLQLGRQKLDLEDALSELKTTQNQLVQSEKMAALGELTAGIAHEIQNPLNFVKNFSEVSAELVDELAVEEQKTQADPELKTELLGDLRQNLQKVIQHGGRASAIVKGMLEHSRSVSGEKQPTDLNALTSEHLALAYHAVRGKDPSFDAILATNFMPNLGEVYVVHQEIGRVLLNLFNNAFYALRKKRLSTSPDFVPELTVSTSRSGQLVTLTITDNGTGIPAAVQPKIFQPFFTTKPTGEGTGLGLSLSYDIITKGYGGTLTVESDETTFTKFMITLPKLVFVNLQ